MASLPEGTVTFLFSDIEGSTRLLQDLGEAYADVRSAHHRLLRRAFAKGTEVSTEGDGFFVAFPVATDAVAAAVEAQRVLIAHPWPPGRDVRVRMGLHTGRGVVGPDGYIGLDVHRAARIAAVGHGGQVLLSETTLALTRHDLPSGTTARDLGSHRLKDLAEPVRIAELVIEGVPSDHPPLRTVGRAQTNVRLPLTSFVGRDRELEAVARLVRGNRLVTLVGTGGTGKTRLLLHVAAADVAEWPDGVWLVELAPLTDPGQVLPAIARAIGAHEDRGRALLDTVLDYLGPKRLLLLVDNCEHLIARVAELVGRVVAEAPAVTVLGSSREALGVDGETLFQVPSLPLPPALAPVDRQAIDEAPATRLFVERATAADAAFSPQPDDLAAIAEICRRLDGIPLAIELAAARVQVMSVSEIADRLSDRFRLLTGGSRSALPRQQTLEAAIEWSWGLLTDDERMTLRRLAVFAGGCTVDTAAAVAFDRPQGGTEAAVDALDVVGRLVGKSLLAVERGTPTRYRPLESIRQYARDRLVDAGESATIRARHLACFLAVAESAAPRLDGPDMASTLKQLDEERENLRVAIDWGFETDLDAAMRLCVALVVYWRVRSVATGFDVLSRAAARVEALEGWRTSPLAARVLAYAADAAWMVGQAPRGEPWVSHALEIARASGNQRALAAALGAKAVTALFLGRRDGVFEWIAEDLAITTVVGPDSVLAFVHAGMARWKAEAGDIAGARADLEEAERVAQRSGNPEAIGFAAFGRGRVEWFAGNVDAARDAFYRAIDAYGSIGDDAILLSVRSDLAHALRHNGETAEAIATYQRTLPAWRLAGNQGAIANQIESVAQLVAATRPTEAARLLAAAATIRAVADATMLDFEQAEIAATRERLQAALGEPAFTDTELAGRRLDLETVVAESMTILGDLERALSPVDPPGSPLRGAGPGCR